MLITYQHFTIGTLPTFSLIAGDNLLSNPDALRRDSGQRKRGKYKPHLQYER